MHVPAPIKHTWSLICHRLVEVVGETTFNLWLADVELVAIDGDTLTLVTPPENAEWLADRFDRVLHACAEQVLGRPVAITITAAGTQRTGEQRPAARGARRIPVTSASAEDHLAGAAAATPSELERSFDVEPNPKYTFERFVIGDSNRLAHAACLAVAEMPSLAYNPLYLAAQPGLGKTHLLHSIANYIQRYSDGLTVRYVTVEAFTNHFLTAIRPGGDVDALRKAYRDVDVLLVDDVQFLERKAKTEEEFFHTFNALQNAGGQLVVASDRPPRDLSALADRLRERFESGLVTEIKPPDLNMRLAILRKRVQQDRVPNVDPAALQLIAERLDGNVRVLEGALIRVVAFGSLTSRKISAALAGEVLDGLYGSLTPRRRTLAEIQQRTAAAFDISVDELLSPSRAARVAWARQVAMYLARELTDETLPAIGHAFGGRNHSTVINACKRAAARIAEDPEAFDQVNRLSAELQDER